MLRGVERETRGSREGGEEGRRGTDGVLRGVLRGGGLEEGTEGGKLLCTAELPTPRQLVGQ